MMPLPYRWLTSLMLRYNGSSLLIDCGEGTQIAIKEKGWTFKPIDVICFTHYHADHISGLPGLLLSMGNAERTEPLTMIGPKGLERVVGALRMIAPELPFEITPVGSRKEILLQPHSEYSLTPTKLIIQSNISAPLAKLEVSFSRFSSSIDYILADIHLQTFSDESLNLENIVFSSFSNSGSIFSSSYTILPISFAQSVSVQSALISIKKCSIDSSLISNSDSTFSHPSNVPSTLSSHSIDLLSSAEQLSSASEILSFLETLKKNGSANVNDNLILQIANLAKTERLYGNMKESCLKKIKEYA